MRIAAVHERAERLGGKWGPTKSRVMGIAAVHERAERLGEMGTGKESRDLRACARLGSVCLEEMRLLLP